MLAVHWTSQSEPVLQVAKSHHMLKDKVVTTTTARQPHLSFFSLPEVRWLLTKPKDVPLNMKDTPTAPLLPAHGKKKCDEVETLRSVLDWPLTLQTGGAASVPRVLAMPVFTLSEKMWEILFSCSGFAKTTIRMFHSVWIATWRLKNGIIRGYIN